MRKYLLIALLLISDAAIAKFYSAANHIDVSLSVEECINIAKEARKQLSDSDFDEIIIDEYYSYSPDDLNVIVVCNEIKSVVFISISATKDQVVDKWIKLFSEAYKLSKRKGA